jgi:LL-diaminopimelate aminotransferase
MAPRAIENELTEGLMITTEQKYVPAQRIADIKPYFFTTLNQHLVELKAKGIDIIRLDMGSPDLPPADFIIETLAQSANSPGAHGYAQSGGTPRYREAIAVYYQKRFGVELDKKHEVLGLLGSKEGLFDLSQALLNPGDIALIPDPGYPVYTSGAQIAGAEIVWMPLREEDHFLPDFSAIPGEVADKAKILWINYPNNPTGAIASLDFFEEAVRFARQHHILLAHDAPYVDVCFDGYEAPSLMQVTGAKEVAIEFNSLSKAYNMGGWRLGMAVGQPEVLGYLHTYKSQADNSGFIPVMDAGAQALSGDQSWLAQRNQIYRERRDIVLKGLREAGFTADTPPATIYIWARLPNGLSSIDFCSRLLEATGVSTTPGVVYGNSGEGYVRISLGIATERIKVAMERFVNFMKDGGI